MGKPTLYGGQAVIEGVMMRGPLRFAVAVRRSNGEIALTNEPVPPVLRPRWQKLPFLRGAFALVDSMALGTRALFWAAKVVESDTVGSSGPDNSRSKVVDMAIGGAMFTGLAFAIFLFKILPQFVLEPLRAGRPVWQVGLFDVVVRMAILSGYILSVSRMAHVRRVFEYHGAEHKAINALEAGVPLTVDNVHAASRLHPRCGTSFLVIVVVLSVLAVSPFYGQPLPVRIAIQLGFLFPVAGVAFEILRLAGIYRNNPIADALSRPGMWTQYLTTREPDRAQCAVAIAALEAVMQADAARDAAAVSPDVQPGAPPVSDSSTA